MNNSVYIIGIGMTKFGKYLDKSIKMLTGEALQLALGDCELQKNDVEAAFFSNSFWGMYTMQHCIRGQVALSANGLDGIPITNVENACGGGSSALHGAWTAIKAGLYDCILAIGSEKIYDEDRTKMMLSFATGSDFEILDQTIAAFQATAKKLKSQDSNSNKKSHSVAMDMYAAGARFYMEKHGITQKQLAIIAAKAHNNSVMNPLAQYNFPMTVEEVLKDREVSYPLTRAMCAPVGDGAAAAILCSENFLKKHLSKRAVEIKASILKSGTREGESDVGPRSSAAAYEMAGLGPEDINIVEVHDASAFGELMVLEELGFCPIGGGGILAESGATAIDGKIPVNTGGGLIARGHPVGASGIAQIHELVTQLRGEAGKRQVKNPKIALAENGGGLLGMGAAVMCIHILKGS